MPRRPPLRNYGELRRMEMPEKQKYARISCGSFSRVERVLKDGSLLAREWMYCREYFQDVSTGARRVLFSHRANMGYNVAAFIDRVETKLKIQPRSQFGPTQRTTITWGRISPWWTTTSMRRSLFTAFLRAGTNYRPMRNPPNFEDALLSINYTRQTEEAVLRFMKGYTKYTGNQRGWYNQFRWGSGTYLRPQRPSAKEVKQLLVKPE
jgi:hypothetical protein